MELFAVGRGSGTGELTGQRILQVATILRNLSFEEDNVPLLGGCNTTSILFLLLIRRTGVVDLWCCAVNIGSGSVWILITVLSNSLLGVQHYLFVSKEIIEVNLYST